MCTPVSWRRFLWYVEVHVYHLYETGYTFALTLTLSFSLHRHHCFCIPLDLSSVINTPKVCVSWISLSGARWCRYHISSSVRSTTCVRFINLNMEGEPTRVHTHSSHSQTPRLLSTSSPWVPIPPIYLLCLRIRHLPTLVFLDSRSQRTQTHITFCFNRYRTISTQSIHRTRQDWDSFTSLKCGNVSGQVHVGIFHSSHPMTGRGLIGWGHHRSLGRAEGQAGVCQGKPFPLLKKCLKMLKNA